MSWSPFRDAKTRGEWFAQLWQAQGGRCALCGHLFAEPGTMNEQCTAAFSATFDHIVPRVRGGSDELANLQLAHAACNHSRGDGSVAPKPVGIPRALKKIALETS